MRLVLEPQDLITRWVFQRTGAQWIPGIAAGIGVAEGEELVAAAAFTDYTGPNVAVHLAIDDKRAALLLFRHIGSYAFEQLGCRRLTLTADSSNIEAIRLHQKLGAVLEGVLVGAGRKGDDVHISRLTADCEIWRKLNGRRNRVFVEGRNSADSSTERAGDRAGAGPSEYNHYTPGQLGHDCPVP